jgi:hypothetical protein
MLLSKKGAISNYYTECTGNVYWLTPLISPMSIIVNDESRICFYHHPKSLMKYKVSLEEIKELERNIAQ